MFGQVVIGPPGAGKTTYCKAMQQFLISLGRKVAIINLDPANDTLPYKCTVDIAELITLESIMENLHLGPNGSLIYAMEYLEQNATWLYDHLRDITDDHYLLFDCPGQVELYTHHNSVRNLFSSLTSPRHSHAQSQPDTSSSDQTPASTSGQSQTTTQTERHPGIPPGGHRLTAVHLVDSHYCSDPAKFVSILLTSLCAMLQVELPHINILSKVDLIEKYGKLPFNLDFFTEVQDLSYLMSQFEEDEFFVKYKKLNKAIMEVVEDYSLVTFIALDVQDKSSMLRVIRAVDKSNGYVFGDLEERNIQTLLSCAVGTEFESEKIQNITEKYMDTSDAIAEKYMDTSDSNT